MGLRTKTGKAVGAAPQIATPAPRGRRLMGLLPQVGWADVATKRDLDALEERMSLRFELVDQRFEALDQWFEASEHKLMAAFRGEKLAQTNAITGQVRTLLLANVGTVLS